MRKQIVVAMFLLLMGSAAVAQDKYESKWHCPKPTDMKEVEVGDVPGHMYTIAQGTCEVKSSTINEKSGKYTEIGEVRKNSFTSRGHIVINMENDKLIESYTASGDPVKKTESQKWTIQSGTGKHKGAKGSGTCTATMNDDGSSDWDCTGTVTLPK